MITQGPAEMGVLAVWMPSLISRHKLIYIYIYEFIIIYPKMDHSGQTCTRKVLLFLLLRWHSQKDHRS